MKIPLLQLEGLSLTEQPPIIFRPRPVVGRPVLVHRSRPAPPPPPSSPAKQSLSPPPRKRSAFSTRTTNPPTWGQIKHLTGEAKKVVLEQGAMINPGNLLVAMLAIIACQVTGGMAAGLKDAYWA